MREPPRPPRTPRPIAAFFLSLLVSSLALGVLLLYDGRVLELKKARAEIRQLDEQIAGRRRENDELRAAIGAANRHELPAEKVAREELHLVHPEDVVLLYPAGSLSPAEQSKGEKAPRPTAGTPSPTPSPSPPPR